MDFENCLKRLPQFLIDRADRFFEARDYYPTHLEMCEGAIQSVHHTVVYQTPFPPHRPFQFISMDPPRHPSGQNQVIFFRFSYRSPKGNVTGVIHCYDISPLLDQPKEKEPYYPTLSQEIARLVV